MKKTIAFLIVAVMCCALCFAACDGGKEADDKLVVYNWADYIYDVELTDFKEYYKNLTGRTIDVTYVTFDTNETMLTKILNGDSVVDVMCPSEYAIQKLLEQDLLLPINYFDEEKFTEGFAFDDYSHNSGNVDSNFVEKVDEVFSELTVTTDGGETKTVKMTDYFVPYMYGTLGILYNKVYFEELGIYNRETLNNANWGILFNDDGKGNLLSDGLTNRIYMKDSIRDSYAATLFYMKESGKLDGLKDTNGVAYTDMPIGELINTVDDQLVELCSEVLKEQKQQLYGYEVDFGKNELIQGIAYVDLAWSGDALYAVEESWDDNYRDPMLEYDGEEKGGYTLGYYVPHGSGNIWFDGWVIPKTCPESHVQAAKIFINYLNELEVGAQNMMEIGYTSAVSSDKIRNDVASCEILAENYNVYSLEYRKDVELRTEKDFATATEFEKYMETFDYADWAEFEEYFFDYCDPIDDSNWRYPFVIADGNAYNRTIDDLGVMKDFGANNYKVSTMWEDVRSTGITVWGLLGWTVLALAVVVGIVALVVLIQRRGKMRVIVKKAEK